MLVCLEPRIPTTVVIRSVDCVEALFAVIKILHVAKVVSTLLRVLFVGMPSTALVKDNPYVQGGIRTVHQVPQSGMAWIVKRRENVLGAVVFLSAKLEDCKVACVTKLKTLARGAAAHPLKEFVCLRSQTVFYQMEHPVCMGSV